METAKLEARLNAKLTDGIEQIGGLIKDYAKKQRKNNERISDLEVKIFGNSKDPRARAK